MRSVEIFSQTANCLLIALHPPVVDVGMLVRDRFAIASFERVLLSARSRVLTGTTNDGAEHLALGYLAQPDVRLAIGSSGIRRCRADLGLSARRHALYLVANPDYTADYDASGEAASSAHCIISASSKRLFHAAARSTFS